MALRLGMFPLQVGILFGSMLSWALRLFYEA